MWIRIDNQDVGSEAATIERVRNRRSTVRTAGADGSANVGMSSEMWVRIPHAVSLRFPEEGSSSQG
jgi:hypothetical protein